MPAKRSNESDVWKYVEKGDRKAQCKLCDTKMSYVGGCTSAIRNHLRSKHATVCGSTDNSKTPMLSNFGFGAVRPCSDSRREKITDLIAKMIVANALPISLVDNEEFVQLIDYLEPNYKVPCRQTMTTRLDCMKATLEKEMKDDLKEAAAAVAITTDIWTSLANDAYISMTASYITPQWIMKTPTLADSQLTERHTKEVIIEKLDTLTTEWGIKDKVVACVHDAASNMKETTANNDWEDVGCSAHKLHLVVTAALGIDKVTNSTLSKLVSASSRLVGHFSHSVIASQELEKRQAEMTKDVQPVKLIQYVKTRWNSVYDMFERLHKLR